MKAPVKCAACPRTIEPGKAFVRHTRQGDSWVETLLCWRCSDVSTDGGGSHAS